MSWSAGAAEARSLPGPLAGSGTASRSGKADLPTASDTSARGIETEIGGLFPPGVPQFPPVDVALGGARHQRRALGKPRIVGGVAEIPLRHRRLDLGAPGRERLDRVARDAGDLEAPVGMGLLDAVAEPRQAAGKLVAVEHADQLLPRVEALVGHRAPFPVLALHHVGDYRMAMELRIEVARGVVAEGGGDDFLSADAPHPAGFRILHPCLCGVLLDPGQRRLHGAVVRLDDAVVAAHQGGDGDGFRGREGEVAAGPVEDFAVLAAAAEPGVRAVRHLAFEDRPKSVRIDRTLQPELFRPLADPGARRTVIGIVLGVIAVALVIGRALGGRGERADREHVRSTRGSARRPDRRHRRRPLPDRRPAGLAVQDRPVTRLPAPRRVRALPGQRSRHRPPVLSRSPSMPCRPPFRLPAPPHRRLPACGLGFWARHPQPLRCPLPLPRPLPAAGEAPARPEAGQAPARLPTAAVRRPGRFPLRLPRPLSSCRYRRQTRRPLAPWPR